MSNISAIASSAVAVNHSKLQENVTVNLLRMNAQAEQEMAALVVLGCIVPAGLAFMLWRENRKHVMQAMSFRKKK